MMIYAALALVGCAGTESNALLDRPTVISSDPNTLWDVCRQELLARGFAIDRYDRRAELIETYPLVSKQWFEFWRHDVVDPDALAESSLQNIRRKVKLTLNTMAANHIALDCRVDIERLASHPQSSQRLTRARDIFAGIDGSMPTLQSWTDRRQLTQHWIDLGRDTHLEIDILQHIAKAYPNHK